MKEVCVEGHMMMHRKIVILGPIEWNKEVLKALDVAQEMSTNCCGAFDVTLGPLST